MSDLSHSCACWAGKDPETYMWFLAWWPHSLLGGHNPFLTSSLFAPDHVNLGALILVPAAAIVASPVTLLFGPLVSYNVLALAAPVLAALAAFGLCRYLTGRVAPALLGGYVFGFSPYMLGHMMGHLDLLLVFPIPAVVHVALRYMDGRISRRRCMALLVTLLITLYLSSPELTLTFVLTGALALGLALALSPEHRGALLELVRVVLLSGLLAVAVVSLFIYYALTGDLSTPFFAGFPQLGTDALGFVVPTDIVRLGRAWFRPVSAGFLAGLPESGVYVGFPIALIVTRYGVTRWNAAKTRILVVLLGLVVLLAMGSRLLIDGHPTLKLPWEWLSRLPLLGRAIPVRLGLYLFLIVAVLLALWLADSRRRAVQRTKWALALLGLALLVPNLGQRYWISRPSNPPFFTTDAYRTVIAPHETVLALPWGNLGDSMLWQAETGFWFRMPGAYLGALLPPDYVRDPLLPALSAPTTVPDPGKLRSFLIRRRVGAVVVDPATPRAWIAALAAAGLHGRMIGGVLFYRV